jgi:hypothetical protein
MNDGAPLASDPSSFIFFPHSHPHQPYIFMRDNQLDWYPHMSPSPQTQSRRARLLGLNTVQGPILSLSHRFLLCRTHRPQCCPGPCDRSCRSRGFPSCRTHRPQRCPGPCDRSCRSPIDSHRTGFLGLNAVQVSATIPVALPLIPIAPESSASTLSRSLCVTIALPSIPCRTPGHNTVQVQFCAPRQHAEDFEELHEYRGRKRKEFEERIHRTRCGM